MLGVVRSAVPAAGSDRQERFLLGPMLFLRHEARNILTQDTRDVVLENSGC